MNNIISQMLKKYRVKTLDEKEQAIREIVQEITLACLSKIGFFNKAAFFGGTALRIFYDLPRFSEDLDFVLIKPNSKFDLNFYLTKLENQLKSYGLSFVIKTKSKTKSTSRISGALKSNEIMGLKFFFNEDVVNIDSKQNISIKFDLETSPAEGAKIETKYKLNPVGYPITLYDLPTLFATKISAILTRPHVNNVKGRDLYDYIFYLKNSVSINLPFLKNQLIKEGMHLDDKALTLDKVKALLIDKFKTINMKQAIEDVYNLVNNKAELEIWSNEFFIDITKQIN